jgi:putative hemolysin
MTPVDPGPSPSKPIFDTAALLPKAWQRGLYKPVQGLVEAGLGLAKMNRIYPVAAADQASPAEFAERSLAGVGVTVDPPSLVLPDGPLVIVGNHPFGALEALWLLRAQADGGRPIKLLANAWLHCFEPMRPILLGVDVLGERGQAAAANRNGMREALRWLKDGGCLGLFPSGVVAARHWGKRGPQEGPWTKHLERLVQSSNASVLPLYFHGSNSALFHAAGLVHPMLRTLMLPREAAYPSVRHLKVTVGPVLGPERLARLAAPGHLSEALRERTLMLATSTPPPAAGQPKSPNPSDPNPTNPNPSGPGPGGLHQGEAPLNDGHGLSDSAHLAVAQEVTTVLAQDRSLAKRENLEVFWFHGREAPALMHALGRRREEAFRAAGEGTGRDEDLDAFDPAYAQILLWDHSQGRIAGAYRAARVDQRLDADGPKGLYSAGLFRLDKALLTDLRDALELGRSFIAPDYQRHPAALPLLWRGLGAYALREAGCARLFGCVSISPRFQSTTQRLLVGFMRRHLLDVKRSAWVRPRNPVRDLEADTGPQPTDLRSLEQWVDEMENGRLGLPPLVKHYTRLGARVLAFNRDPDFNDTVDALILLDLRQAPALLLKRYLDKEDMERIKGLRAA